MPKRDKTRLRRDHRTEEEKAADRERGLALIYARLHGPPQPPMQVARKFLFFTFNEPYTDPWERIAGFAAGNPRSILEALVSIEALLADPPSGPYVLQDLVWWVAGQEEEGLTEESAVAWLRGVTEGIRERLGDKQPPRLGVQVKNDKRGDTP